MYNSIFSSIPEEAGFRLQNVEIYNWGVFDAEIYKISPCGNTSLLTGANGSGKTSFVDAILTLLVPERRMRFYNLSSGSSGRNERTEESYVLGEYGDAESTEKGKETLRLRQDKDSTFSILLAVFKSEERYLTLAQVRWFTSGELRRAYIVAQTELSIESDFIPFDSNGQWRRAMKNKHQKINNREVIEFFDGPANYAQCIRKYLGMKSEKALTLFSQTVGLKVLGNLNDFIRQNMLEETSIENEFIHLKEGFRKLLDAHTEIEKAYSQMSILEPLVLNVEKYNNILSVLKRDSELKETLPPYFAFNKRKLLEQEIKTTKVHNVELAEKLIYQKKEIEKKREQEIEIDANIRNDEIGKQIKSISQQITQRQNELETKRVRCNKYNAAAKKISFIENPSETEFFESIENANNRIVSIREELPEHENKWADIRHESLALKNEYVDIAKEYEVLSMQSNNITGRVAEIRKEIALHCGIEESRLPFIGELLKIEDSEKRWEAGIEKVLHNFALRIIVPNNLYKEVNNYVNSTNLNGRIVYHNVDEREEFINSMYERDNNLLVSKLEIKKDSPYADWVENKLITEFDYVCSDDMEVFSRSKRALTSGGLIKNSSKHEKDDRNNNSSKEQRFVLGWDNSSKKVAIEKLLLEKKKQLNNKENILLDCRNKQNSLHIELENINAFLQYDKFDEIDWPKIAVEIEELKTAKVKLGNSNNHVEELSNQLGKLRQEIKGLEKSREELSSEKVRAQDIFEKMNTQFDYLSAMLDAYRHVDLKSIFKEFLNEFEPMLTDISAQNIDTVRHKVETELNRRISDLNDKRIELGNKIQNQMRDFREPSEDIRRKFIDWISDTHKLPVEIEYVQEYIDIYNNISSQGLAAYRERFKKYLNEDMINRMTNFTAIIERQEEEIQDNIVSLNKSLERITFRSAPRTFIQLYAEKENSREIKEFRNKMASWKPDINGENIDNDDILEKSFNNIKSLIDDLSDNELWRKTVTDVRNWFSFKAKEHYVENPEQIYKIYESTGKLSGGEKAQLTYTILGSALAYQFGIAQNGLNPNSFRFICVDESFSNQDDEKSRYLMELCKQLHLQLLVVTPEDKMHIVEPYISAIHIVKRIENRNSIIFDMPIRQYNNDEKKEYLN
ncbi:MAG: SbcC/MukB-like Walker B domain-containing protein [Bacteroidales bacterium]|nr:SbcC/MukB-like Walker B domain-containing protein [Bacteroidales bacterium]